MLQYNFKTGEQQNAELYFHFFDFTAGAQKELEQHHSLREDFLKILYDYIDLVLHKLQYANLQIDLLEDNSQNEGRQNDIPEVWLALKKVGYLTKFLKEKIQTIAVSFLKYLI